jgi:tRNA nucleotidyltransferase (CCA-adding enzyme)
MKEVNAILSEQLDLISPTKEDYDKINKISKEFQQQLTTNLKNQKIKAQVFLGGSLAKNTLVKKDPYDIDIFVRFDQSYKDKDISKLLEKAIPKAKRVHGSRDYFQQTINKIIVEIIPVIKITKPFQATNVTDLSYFHVNYMLTQIKNNKNLTKEIQLAKTFAHAQNVYGAESYIHGFSGYALELLISHYKTFIAFIKAISDLDIKKGKLIIDQEKFYKNQQDVLTNLNKSKQNSPIILIDPTNKERNASSSLSEETLYKFQNHCKSFLKKPSSEAFKQKHVKDEFKNKKPIILTIKTNKQPGDIAGTKSKKFTLFLLSRLKREFTIKKDGFEYDDIKNIARLYLLLEKKKPTEIRGPPITSKNNLAKFKKAHKNTIVKKGYIFTTLKHNLSFKEWFDKFKKDDKKIIRDMGIKSIE